MTQDEIIEMPPYLNASYEGDDLYSGNQVRELMKLVAAKEREACAKIVQTHYEANDDLRTKGSLASVLDYIKFKGEA